MRFVENGFNVIKFKKKRNREEMNEEIKCK